MTQNKANAEPRFRRESHDSGTSLSFFATKTQVNHKSQLVSQPYAVAGEGSAPWGTNGQRSRKQVGTEEWKVRGIKLSQVRIKSPQSPFFCCQSYCGISMCVGFHSLKWSWYHYHLSFLNSSIDIAKIVSAILQKFKIRPYFYPGLMQTLLPILRDDAGDVLTSGKENRAKEMSFELLVWVI